MSAAPLARCEIADTVPFHDLDPMGVVWHGNYFRYFDRARFALFRDRGVDLYAYSRRANVILPLTRTATKHILPLRYADRFVCSAELLEIQYKIVLSFELRLADCGTRCATARSEQVAVKLPEMELLFEIPAEIRRVFGA